ncbi:MAG: hypothetical protein IIU40_02805 [Lachnospiraceae bacterium]|nr:hypothetical protein [Lachnospiraceae bacterium]
MKHKYTIAGVGIILIAVALIGGTMAANNAQTSQAAEAEISVNGLKGGIEVSSEDPVFAKNSDVTATPGGDYDLSLNAVNAGGDLDYASYFKAVIYKEWNDANGDYIDPVESEAITEDRVRIGDTYLDEVEPGDVVNGWIVASVDEEEIVLFYTKPVDVGQATTPFIDGVTFAENLDNRYTQATYNLDFEVTAVQTVSGEAAFASSFGVYPVINEDGNIVSVSEEKPATATE